MILLPSVATILLKAVVVALLAAMDIVMYLPYLSPSALVALFTYFPSILHTAYGYADE
jgi:hypothetical protein